MNSSINEETRSHLERLIAMYAQMLSNPQFTFPSRYAVRRQIIANGFITVNLRNGRRGRDKIFGDIRSGDSAKIGQQIKMWRQEGIEYVESPDETEKYKLKMPIRNMNDSLLTHIFLASNFGNRKVDDDHDLGVMLIYTGLLEYDEIRPVEIPVDGSNFPAGMAKLKEQAEAQKKLGHHYMHVVMQSSKVAYMENIDIAALLALNPDTMEAGKAYPIGDCNWEGNDMSQDVPRLAVRKTNGTPPTLEFGILQESKFEKEDVLKFKIYGTEIKKLSSQGLNPFGELDSLPSPFAKGIRQVFSGGTDSIDNMSLVSVRAKLKAMPLSEARGIWQTIANEVAVDCFDADGHVDVEKLRRWMTFLGNAENFKKAPLRFIPHAEFMRSQMYTVCESLRDNRNGARDRLDAAAGITVGTHGQSILDTMSKGRQTPLRPAEAILASLFTPHRQWSLPTCTMNSLINEEIRNHLERLIAMYEQMLASGQLTFPSGHTVWQQIIANGFITADLRNGGRGRAAVFEDITGGDSTKRTQQIAKWRQEGIEYIESPDETEKYKLRMPVHNMNDVLFTHFLLASNFGNSKMGFDENYRTMLVYAGIWQHRKTYSPAIPVGGSKFLTGMAKLKEQAKAQQKLGHSYMRVATTGTIFGRYGHAENIDINALVALDPHTMEIGKAYSIGDRNWSDWDMSRDIPRLAVRKTNGTPPTFEFGTLWGSRFEKINMTAIEVYGTEIERFDSPGFFSLFRDFSQRYLDFYRDFFKKAF
ncbi:MAG: hypothetical protein LBI47_01605 [Puniceicoccales bacterium]|jgi:hypothetical protein|nr:hypothetical protein [Puniceicoccales bacterium]